MQPLVTRAFDPLLGIFTGVLAFYLNETHPRTAREEGRRLHELVAWKWARFREGKRREREGRGEEEWERVRREFERK